METIFTNYNYDRYMEDARENVAQWYEEETTEELVEEYAARYCEDDWDFYYDCIKKYLQDNLLVATRTVGTWHGSEEGGIVIESPDDFIKLLVDCDYVEIAMDDTQMYVKCSHHDGTNHYKLREILKSDYEYYGEHRYDDRRKLCEYLFNRGRKPQIEWYL